MRITTGLFSVCLILACVFTLSCNTLPPVRATELTACFTTPFTCGFQAENKKTGTPIYGIFSRTANGDILTVTGTYGTTAFLFSGKDAALLCDVSGNEKRIPLSLPPDADITAICRLFSHAPDDRDTAQRTQNGITVTAADGTELCFSRDAVPVTVSDMTHSVIIHSFQTEAS